MRANTSVREQQLSFGPDMIVRVYDVPAHVSSMVFRGGLSDMLTPVVTKNYVVEIPLVITGGVSFIEMPTTSRWLMLYQAARAFHLIRDRAVGEPRVLEELKKVVSGMKETASFQKDRVMRMYHDYVMLIGVKHFYTEEFPIEQHQKFSYYMGSLQHPYLNEIGKFASMMLKTPMRAMHAQGPVVPEVRFSNSVTTNIEVASIKRFACAREDDAILCSIIPEA